MGKIMREVAKKHNLTLEELNELGEKEEWVDKEADALTVKIGKKQDNFIFVARLAYHFIPNSIKVYLECDVKVGAKRIIKDLDESRDVEKFENIKEAIEKLNKRVQSDKLRYEKYYQLNPFDKSNYDLVIDTTYLNIQQVLDKLMDLIE